MGVKFFQPFLRPWLYIAVLGQSKALPRGTEASSLSLAPNPGIEIWNHAAGQWEIYDPAIASTQIADPLNGGQGATNNAYMPAWAAAHQFLSTHRVRLIVEAEGAEVIETFTDGGNHAVRFGQQLTASETTRLDAVFLDIGESARSQSVFVFNGLLEQFFTHLKSRSQFHDDSVLIIGSLLEPGANNPPTSTQNDTLRLFVQNNHPRVRLANNDNVETSDNIHPTGPGAVAAGRTFADAVRAPTITTSSLIDNYLKVAAIATLLAYFDSRYGYDNPSNVSSWTDRTGTYTAVNELGDPYIDQTTGALVFDNPSTGEGNLTFTPAFSAGPKTLLFLINAPDQQQNHVMMDTDGDRTLIFLAGNSDDVNDFQARSPTILTNGTVPPLGVPTVLAVVIDDVDSRLLIDGVQDIAGDLGTFDLSTATKVHLGASNSGHESNGSYEKHRFIVLDGALTNEQIAEVGSLLMEELA